MARVVKPPEERRAEIIQAAITLFLEKTYEVTTTTDVMKMLGIAKGTIYHYFSSKDELLDAAVERLAADYLDRRLPAMRACTGGAIERMAQLFSRDQLSEQEREATRQLHQPGNAILHARLLAVLVEQMAPIFGQLIVEGCQEGVLHTDHPLECAELLLSGIQFLTDEGIHAWPQASILRRTRAFPGIADHLLGARPGTFAFLFPDT